jgi:beta-1,2-mannosidase
LHRRARYDAGIIHLVLPLCLAMSLAHHANAQEWVLGPFQRPVSAPVIAPDASAVFEDPITGNQVHWEYAHTFNPAAVVKDGRIVVLYRAEDDSGQAIIGGHTSRLGIATSDDGIHFTTAPEPVFYPAKDAQQEREWPGGVEDPRLAETGKGMFVLTYTQWNRKIYTIGVATSNDLLHWQKYGPIFASADGGKYQGFAYKSSGIVTKVVKGKLVAARLRGKYWMYWGEGQIRLATSKDLIHWTPVEDANGRPKVLLEARSGMFDSGFPEVGGPPVVTADGIVVFYNGKNASTNGDANIAPGAYSAGQALFSADDPSHLIARMDHPYLKPELPFEKTGQYAAGTVFTEGLVLFKDNWWLYYGTADSYVGVASAPASSH